MYVVKQPHRTSIQEQQVVSKGICVSRNHSTSILRCKYRTFILFY
jgi:hypothetical protein